MAMRAKLIVNLVKLASLIPFSVAQWLGYALGTLLYWIPNPARHVARINLGLCFPEHPRQERERMLHRCLVENSRTFLELPGIWRDHPEKWMRRVDGREGAQFLQRYLDRGKGVIVAVPHLGNWELHAHYLSKIAPFTALYRPPRQQELEEIIRDGRSRTGARLVPTNAQGVKALYGALKAGEIVAILPDQQPKSKEKSAGVFAPFFGEPALTMVLLNRLARKTGAAVVFSYPERLPGGAGFRMHWLEAPEDIDHKDPEVAAAALNRGVEACVRECPDQYQWSYKRFAATPDGSSSRYSKKR
jgi:KDO2-lipid IV(A) lauroyltransferase